MSSPGFLAALTRLRTAERKVDAAESKPSPKEPSVPEALQAVAEDVLIALGQDYGVNGDESQRNAFEDKAKRLARALHACFIVCESMPHEEYGD